MIIEKEYDCIPTLKSFHSSTDKHRLIVGPFRSGKSVAAIVDMWMRALQEPIDRRTCCVRRTYRDLKDTVIKTFFEWIPKESGKWSEADLTFLMPLPHGHTWEILFRSAETEEDIRKFRGLELTDFWIDEAQENNSEVKAILSGRLSWPKGSDESVFRSILTTNPCAIDHWIYKQYVKEPLKGHAYWRQSARENPHIHASYYDDLEAQYRDRPELKRRYVDGDWGAVHSGKPVYLNEFNWNFHVAKGPIAPAQGVEIYCGWDFGLTPACVFTQIHPDGRWLVLRELWSEDMGIDEFSDLVVDFCNREYPGFTFVDVGDPAGKARAATDEKSCYDILRSKRRVCRQAPTNAILPRLEAVKRKLTRTAKGHPQIVIDPRCEWLIEGFNGGYKYATRGATQLYHDVPEKNKYSHVHDALQYIALALFGYADFNERLFRDPLPGQLGVVNA